MKKYKDQDLVIVLEQEGRIKDESSFSLGNNNDKYWV